MAHESVCGLLAGLQRVGARSALRPLRSRRRRLALQSVAASALLIGGLMAFPARAAAAAQSADAELTAQDVESWADELFGKAYQEHRFSALAVAVTSGEQVLLSKGYGLADRATGAPISPDRSQFRIGSITKTFLATAVAQLLEAGRIASLDDPANRYLRRVQLPQGFGKDVTIRHLLTHRGGFEDKGFNMASTAHLDVPVSAEVVSEFAPRIVRPPGTVSVYSNFGTAVLGVMVEDITGQTLQNYLLDKVFRPLGMTNTLVAYAPQPTPGIVTPYVFHPGRAPEPVGYLPLHPFMAPAGSINSTASDMAKYAMAHARAGKGAQGAILSADAFELMHREYVSNHEDASGFGMLFMTYRYNGMRVIEHGGSWPGFESLLLIVPERQIGVFVTFAGGGTGAFEPRQGGDGRADAIKPKLGMSGVRRAVLRRVLGAPRYEAMAPGDLTKYVGTYVSDRRNYSTIEKMQSVLQPSRSTISVEQLGEDGLRIGGNGPYRRIKPELFAMDGLPLEANFYQAGAYAFNTDEAGRVTGLTPFVNAGVHVKSAWYENPYFLRALLVAAVVVCSTAVLAWVWRTASPHARAVRAAASVFGLSVIALVAYGIRADLFAATLRGDRTPLIWLLVLTNLSAVLGVAAISAVLIALRRRAPDLARGGSLLQNIHMVSVGLGAVALLYCLSVMNLLGMKTP